MAYVNKHLAIAREDPVTFRGGTKSFSPFLFYSTNGRRGVHGQRW